MTSVIDRKYLSVSWRNNGPRPDRRHWRFRHNRDVASVYVQIEALEIVVWYRDVA